MKEKKNRVIILAVTLVIFIISFLWNTPEKKTLRYFNSHRTEMEAYISNNDFHEDNHLNIASYYWDGEHPIVEFIVLNRGIVSASQYYGVFYSYNDTPVAFQNADIELIDASENEWTWKQEDGDNHGTVRRLDANWFYFEASF